LLAGFFSVLLDVFVDSFDKRVRKPLGDGTIPPSFDGFGRLT